VAWAIFHGNFEFDFRPLAPVCQIIKASDVPQQWPERVIAAAVAAGCAERADVAAEQRREIDRAKGAPKRRSPR